VLGWEEGRQLCFIDIVGRVGWVEGWTHGKCTKFPNPYVKKIRAYKRVIIQPTKEIKTKAKSRYFIGFGVLSYRVLMVGSLQKVTVFHKKEIQQNATLLI